MYEKHLSALGIAELNPMQHAAISTLNAGHDLVLLSPTGSGKTLAYLLPLVERLDAGKKEVQALILVPSRELALQIEVVFRKLNSGLKVNCCYGGHPIQTEINNLSVPPALLIGTPGRVIDHIDRGTLDLSGAITVVLDEYDKCLEMGFVPQMEYALGKMPGLQHRVLTSATGLEEVPEFVGMREPVMLDYLLDLDTAARLEVMVVHCPETDKLDTLMRLICTLGDQAMLVFLNHREAVERVSAFLDANRVEHEHFHGGLDQRLRERTLVKFRNGSSRILVATDLAARGLDIPEIAAVVHYHLPLTEDAYIHRNGRTARMHAEGAAYILLGPEERWPDFMDDHLPEFHVSPRAPLPTPTPWVTLYISKGKKAKVNKVDIVGFLCQQGGLPKEEIGQIAVQDDCAYVAVRRDRARAVLREVRGLKIKGQTIIVDIAR